MTNVWLGFSNCLDLNFVLVAATLNAWIFFLFACSALNIVYPFMQSAFDTVGIIAIKSSKSLVEKVGSKKSLT